MGRPHALRCGRLPFVGPNIPRDETEMTILLKDASLAALRALKAAEKGMAPSQLAGYLDKSRQSCERICQRLSKGGFVTQSLEDFQPSNNGQRAVYSVNQRGLHHLELIDAKPEPREYKKDRKRQANKIVRQAIASVPNSVFSLGATR